MAPVQEDVPTQSPSAVGASDMPALNSPERTIELPSTSGMGAVLETTTAPLSSPTTGLVSTGKFGLFSFSIFMHVS